MRAVVGVGAESFVVRDGFCFRVEEKFEGILAEGFAIESRAPAAESFFEFLERDRGELADGANAERVERGFGDAADAGNFAHVERREKFGFDAGGHPDEALRLGLLGGDFRDEARGGESRRAGKAGGLANFAQKFIGGD